MFSIIKHKKQNKKITNEAIDLMMIEEIIKQSISTGSMNPERAKKFAIILDHYQSFNQEAIVNKNTNTNEMTNGNGTNALNFGMHFVLSSFRTYPSLLQTLSEGIHPYQSSL